MLEIIKNWGCGSTETGDDELASSYLYKVQFEPWSLKSSEIARKNYSRQILRKSREIIRIVGLIFSIFYTNIGLVHSNEKMNIFGKFAWSMLDLITKIKKNPRIFFVLLDFWLSIYIFDNILSLHFSKKINIYKRCF